MADPIETTEAITDALAAAPKVVKTDGLEVQEHSIPDLIALENHRSNQAAVRSRGIGIRTFNTRPPGAS